MIARAIRRNEEIGLAWYPYYCPYHYHYFLDNGRRWNYQYHTRIRRGRYNL